MPCRVCPPWMCSGGVPSACVSIRAPICASGPVTRRIGRLDSDASPTSVESNGCPASRPASRRMPVPALPQSSSPRGAFRPSTPTPCTMRCEGDGVSKRTPICAKIEAVARVSSPSRKPSICETPSANAANITARCETDLSPGISSVPCRAEPLRAIQYRESVMLLPVVAARASARANQSRNSRPSERKGGRHSCRRSCRQQGATDGIGQGTATG